MKAKILRLLGSRLFGVLLAGCAVAYAGNAAAVVVGGINFGTIGQVSNLDTTTIAETLITGNGQTLSGYGQVNTVNGASSYCASGTSCRLFFTFTNYLSQNFATNSVEFSSGNIFVYYDPTGSSYNLLNQDSATNYAFINSLTPWVELAGHANLIGATSPTSTLIADANILGTPVSLSFSGSGLLDVLQNSFGITGVQSYLNGNGGGLPQFQDAAGNYADMLLTTSGSNAILNPNDTCTGIAGQWCIEGSADLRGPVTVPEPGTLALLGLAIGIIGLWERRSRSV